MASFFTENKAVADAERAVLPPEPTPGGYPIPVLTGGPPVHDTTLADSGTTEVLGD